MDGENENLSAEEKHKIYLQEKYGKEYDAIQKGLIEKRKWVEGRIAEKTADEKNRRYDFLTGVYTREYMEEEIKKQVAAAEIRGTPLGIFFLDLDGFKTVNDTYGHDVGDRVLVAFTREVRRFISPPGSFGRFGGEEFVILLPGMSAEQVEEIGVQIGEQVRMGVGFGGEIPQLQTVSMGGVMWRGESPEVWIKRADGASYKAKNLGRNRLVMDTGAGEKVRVFGEENKGS